MMMMDKSFHICLTPGLLPFNLSSLKTLFMQNEVIKSFLLKGY